MSIGLQALLLLSDSDWQTIIEFLQDSDRASLRQSCKLACAAVAASVDILRLSGPQLEHLARLRLHDKFPYLRILNLYDEDGDSLSPAELAAFAAMTLPRLQLLETLRMDGLGYLPSTALVAMLRNATQLKCLDTTGECMICCRRCLFASHAFSTAQLAVVDAQVPFMPTLEHS